MLAAQLLNYGSRDSITVQDTEKPALMEDEVLIEVRAAGVNPFDWKVREGMMREYISLPLPATLGGDFSGVIADLGNTNAGLQIGDEVYGQANAAGGRGSWAEYAPVKIQSLARKPESLNFLEAAAVPLTSVSAYQALVETMQLQAGQRILIHGGAGGIGTMAIQLAKYLGAEVITTASADDADYVKNLGAARVIDYRNQDFSTEVSNLDAVYDTVGGETAIKSYAVLNTGGKLVSMVAEPNKELSAKYSVDASHQASRTTPERLAAVAALFDSGALKASIDKTYPLRDAADALEYYNTGSPRGKIVLQVQ